MTDLQRTSSRTGLRVCATVAVLSALLIGGATTAHGQADQTAPQAKPWARPGKANGFKRTKVHRASRSVKIVVTAPRCGGLSRIRVRRERRTIAITTIYEVIPPAPYTVPNCPLPRPLLRTVKLKGRLGKRSIKDGATSPPAVRYQQPRT